MFKIQSFFYCYKSLYLNKHNKFIWCIFQKKNNEDTFGYNGYYMDFSKKIVPPKDMYQNV